MLRPLDPIIWTRAVLVARAKSVLQRDRPLTLRKALRVLALYGRRRLKLAVDKWKTRRLHSVKERVNGRIKHVFTWYRLRFTSKAIQHALGWLQDKTVQIEQIDQDEKTHRIVTTHLAQPFTVEFGYQDYTSIQILAHPLRDATHIRLFSPNNQPMEIPEIHPALCRIRFDSSRNGSTQTSSCFTQEMLGIGLFTVIDPERFLVLLRTLLKLGNEEGPNTPC